MTSKLNNILKSLTTAQHVPVGCCRSEFPPYTNNDEENSGSIPIEEIGCSVTYDWTSEAVCSLRYNHLWSRRKHALHIYQCGSRCKCPPEPTDDPKACCCAHGRCCTIGSCCLNGNCSQGYISECPNPLRNWRPGENSCNYLPGEGDHPSDQCVPFPSIPDAFWISETMNL